MKNSKGFTLVELLVVISIIALLLAVLIPSLSKARDVAKRIVCSQHEKTWLMANVMYSNMNNYSYVPVRYVDSRTGNRTPWLANAFYRNLMHINEYIKRGEDTDLRSGAILLLDLPNVFLCPSDIISKDTKNRYFYDNANVLLSYGYNFTDWSTTNWDSWGGYPRDAGHNAGKIVSPSSKIAFADSVDWWFVWNGGDYRIGWNKLHQANIQAYKALTPRVDGPVLYRHSEGVNFGFYDGHVKYMKKEYAFMAQDRDATPRKPGSWVANTTMYFSIDPRGK